MPLEVREPEDAAEDAGLAQLEGPDEPLLLQEPDRLPKHLLGDPDLVRDLEDAHVSVGHCCPEDLDLLGVQSHEPLEALVHDGDVAELHELAGLTVEDPDLPLALAPGGHIVERPLLEVELQFQRQANADKRIPSALGLMVADDEL